jgi:hypothetical protein
MTSAEQMRIKAVSPESIIFSSFTDIPRDLLPIHACENKEQLMCQEKRRE